MENILIEQIKNNFNKKDINFLMKNFKLIRKIYLIGLINDKELYTDF